MSGYKDYPLSMDTPPEVEAYLFEQLAKKSVADKARMVSDASAALRTVAMIGLRERNPAATEQELRIKLVELLYGPVAAEEIAKRLTGLKNNE